MEGRSGGRVALPPMQHAVQEARDLPLGALGTASKHTKGERSCLGGCVESTTCCWFCCSLALHSDDTYCLLATLTSPLCTLCCGHVHVFHLPAACRETFLLIFQYGAREPVRRQFLLLLHTEL